MSDAPNIQDKRLLERLNALKPSTVQLERQKNLALNSNTSASSLFPSDYTDSAADFASGSSLLAEEDDNNIIAPESLLDGDAIEDLLASLNNGQRLDVGVQLPTETEQEEQGQTRDETKDLVSRAYEFIQQPSAPTGAGTQINANHDNSNREDDDVPDFLRDEEASDDAKDEAEAAKYVEDLLKELSARPPSESPPTEAIINNNNNDNNNQDDDDNLSTRLAALSLPSVPSEQPGRQTQTSRREDNAYLECCCICYDTAAVKCTDCEGDQLFCVRCWWEMHMDDGAESRHKAVKYNPT